MEIHDHIPHVLWDTVIAPEKAFSVPIGMGQSVWGKGPKSIVDTNLDLSNTLPEGWKFTIRELRIEPALGTDPEDLVQVIVRLIIGSKVYVQTPADQAAIRWQVARIPGMPTPGMEFGLAINPSLMLVGGTNFVAWVDSRRAAAVRVSLHGQLLRPIV